MLDPVEKASENLIKLNSSVDQIISSSENLDRCIIKIEAALINSKQKSLSETASILFAATFENPSKSAS